MSNESRALILNGEATVEDVMILHMIGYDFPVEDGHVAEIIDVREGRYGK